MIHARIEGLALPVEKWVEMLLAILKNIITPNTPLTSITPNEAKRGYNKLKVWFHIKNIAEFNRTCTLLSVGSFVRTHEPPKHKKGHKSVWSSKVYKITFMNENGYLIDGFSKRKAFQRNELLKIDGNGDKEG